MDPIKDNPPPPPDVDASGRYWSGRFRLRPSLFGTKLEELQILHDGSSVWVRRKWPVDAEISFKK